MKEEGVSQISITDPDSKLMKNNGKFEVCYNNETAVDMETHITVAYETDNNPADVGSMGSLMKKIKEEYSEEEIIRNVTDKGYQSPGDMVECLEMGVIAEVTQNEKEKEKIELVTEYEENEIDEETRKSKKAEDIRKCIRAGVIPECYKEVIEEIKVEEVKEAVKGERIEEENKSSEEIKEEAIERQVFIKDPNTGAVVCPMGESLGKKSERKNGKERYANKLACKNCKNPCTKCKYKEVELIKNQRELIPKENIIEKPRREKREKVVKKKVKIIQKLDKEIIKRRMQTSEHSQGTMKTADNCSSFNVRGKEKVEAEVALHFIASNIRRVSNMIGVQETIIKIEEMKKKEKKGEGKKELQKAYA